MGLGIKFFFIQVTDIIIYTSTNFLITTFTSPGQVVVYNIAYKLFSVSTMLFTIVLTPMWSAITEAYALDDMEWIKKMVKKIQILGLFFSAVVIILLLFSPFVYKFWIGNKIFVPFEVSFIVALACILRLIFSVFVAFQNGIGKIQIVLYLAFFQAIIYIPLAYLLGKTWSMGIIGIVLTGILIEIPMRIQQVTQYYKVTNRKASGKWLK